VRFVAPAIFDLLKLKLPRHQHAFHRQPAFSFAHHVLCAAVRRSAFLAGKLSVFPAPPDRSDSSRQVTAFAFWSQNRWFSRAFFFFLLF
jgi:hypothetical protein